MKNRVNYDDDHNVNRPLMNLAVSYRAPLPIMDHFSNNNVPAGLKNISILVNELAKTVDSELPDTEDKLVGLRKLLEARDNFFRHMK